MGELGSDDAKAAVARVAAQFGGLDAIEQELATLTVETLAAGHLAEAGVWSAYMAEVLRLRPSVEAGRLSVAEAHAIALMVAEDI